MAGRLLTLLCLLLPLLDPIHATPIPQSSVASAGKQSQAADTAGEETAAGAGAGADVATTQTSQASAATAGGASTCSSGRTYTVVSGDTCEMISKKPEVLAATQTIISLNNISPDCKSLKIGQMLCLPKPCKPYLVKPGQTCAYIAGKLRISVAQFQSYNP